MLTWIKRGVMRYVMRYVMHYTTYGLPVVGMILTTSFRNDADCLNMMKA